MERENVFNQAHYLLLNPELVRREDYDRIGNELFRKAVQKANAGQYSKAIEIAARAMFYARFAGHKLVLSLYSLQAWAHHESGNDSEAVRMCQMALYHIRHNQLAMEEKKEYFIALLHHLRPQQTLQMPAVNGVRIAS